MLRKLIPAIAFSVLTFTPFAAQAAAWLYAPAPVVIAQAPPPPPYDRTFEGPHQVQGWVRYFNAYHLALGVHGQPVSVALHPGTIILPTGLTLRPRMLVRVDGYFSAGVFYANRIVLVN